MDTGQQGEYLTQRLLMELGATILATRLRGRYFEYDLITRDENGVHFIEVKTRRGPGDLGLWVSPARVEHMRRWSSVATRHLSVDISTEICHIDAVSVRLQGRRARLCLFSSLHAPGFTTRTDYTLSF